MAEFKITSEVHTEGSRTHRKSGQNYVISTYCFEFPPHMKPRNAVSYDDDGDMILERKEGRLFLEHSTSTEIRLVGLQLWRGAFFLADYIMSYPHEFEHQNVVELGAGVGLTSIVAAMVAKEVTCTDIDLGEIIPLIKKNAQRNVKFIRGKFNVMALDFLESESWLPNLRRKLAESTIILAADVIYDDNITNGFVNTLETILHSGKNKKTIYIAMEKRYVFTITHLDSIAPSYEEFHRAIAKRKLNCIVEEVPTDFPQYFKYDRVKELVLMKIRLKNKEN